MGAAQSAEELPPNVFLPEMALGASGSGGAPGQLDDQPTQYQNSLSAYCSCWEKKKTMHPDIRIAHNRPAIYQVRTLSGPMRLLTLRESGDYKLQFVHQPSAGLAEACVRMRRSGGSRTDEALCLLLPHIGP